MISFYNSRNEAFKTPFGAVRAGESVHFTLRVPTAYGCETPFLMLLRDGDDAPEQIPLEKTGREYETDIFELTTMAPKAGLYFYWFDLWCDYRKLYRGRGGEAVETTEPGTPYQLTEIGRAHV